MDKDEMTSHVRVNGQMISLQSFRKYKKERAEFLMWIAAIIATGAAIFTFIIPGILLIVRGM
jgi:hypothetical protein